MILISEEELIKVANFTRQYCGITISKKNYPLLEKRLQKRFSETHSTNVDFYLKILKKSPQGSGEISEFINTITIQETFFFRQKVHFEYLRKTILPQLIKVNAQTKKLRILSACCSTGEEPYSIAMVLFEFLDALKGWDIQILAGDISSNALKQAAMTEYDIKSRTFQEMPQEDIQRYFDILDSKASLKETIKKLVTFRYMNIFSESFIEKFDVVFCRNALIYFSAENRERVIQKFHEILAEGGHFFLGYSENLYGWEKFFETVRIPSALVFRKIKIDSKKPLLVIEKESVKTLQIKPDQNNKITEGYNRRESNIYEIKENDQISILYLSGKIDEEELENSERKLEITNKYIQTKKSGRVILDTSKLVFISSSAIELLARLARGCRSYGGEVVAYVPQKSIYGLFERAGLDIVFEIFDSLQDAIETMKGTAAGLY